jgi:uncharacterized protein YeaO (DUF488 family)
MPKIQIKRIYEPAQKTDGFRVLIDRLWPRGISKEEANWDLWAKEMAPSTALREEFHAGGDTWQQFARKYAAEIMANPELDDFMDMIKDKKTVTLLTSTRDAEHADVEVMMEVLQKKM